MPRAVDDAAGNRPLRRTEVVQLSHAAPLAS